MRDFPTGHQLLDTARTLLRESLIPALPAEKRHEALMIANAMSIAMRQLENGDEPEGRELKELSVLLVAGEARDAGAERGPREQLRALNRRLCKTIRSGDADTGAFRDSVRAHLLKVAGRRLQESNPKYLGKGAAR
jgi:hypothetical protein